jgi:ribA/ribD-fused uncharacterized protein
MLNPALHTNNELSAAADKIVQFKGDYKWLSNFYPCDIRFKGKLYPSVEYAYLSAKSDDKAWKKYCADAKEKPSKTKKKSQYIQLVPNWDTIKLDVMRNCLEIKFNQEPLRSWLIETGNSYLQEGNTWGDCFWGVDLDTGEGENHLGILIMDIRSKMT